MKAVLIERNRYFDSVFLMRVSHELELLPGIGRAIVSMATPTNLEGLLRVGFAIDPADGELLPQDLVVALDAASQEAIDSATERLAALLAGDDGAGWADAFAAGAPATTRDAVAGDPALNLALISVPGRYAAREARRALRLGLHVMLFSDNVSVEDEIELKDEAIGRDLLMMGPDCGTAILNGVPLGFANAVRDGAVGIVGASGTGMQEISTIVHRLGGGVSQAIGTGGRDLSEAVGGRMTIAAIAALGGDPRTEVLVVVSKAPPPEIAARVVAALRASGKPAVAHFVTGGDEVREDGVITTDTLADAAYEACRALGIEPHEEPAPPVPEVDQLGSGQRFVRSLFCGGTLAQEAWHLLRRGGRAVVSNVASDPEMRIAAGSEVEGHVVWDLGDDAFTVGVPHPMIEPALRDDLVARCGDDPSVLAVLTDCVLGYGAHPDPAGSLADAAALAMTHARAGGRTLFVFASVTGTEGDPQGYERQRERLRATGIHVAMSNASACRAAARVVETIERRGHG
ncbi:MAG: acyl-CoA synthetase FdrA [Candidatus Bipolaricaulota bacterium]|nr:MAG: acyl-CoA synthetase FdrA [Candidatus Bipolaricaulota bacterium]